MFFEGLFQDHHIWITGSKQLDSNSRIQKENNCLKFTFSSFYISWKKERTHDYLIIKSDMKHLGIVQLFWEGHKNLHNLPHGFDVYWANVKTMRKSLQIFVAFSGKLNIMYEVWVQTKNQQGYLLMAVYAKLYND